MKPISHIVAYRDSSDAQTRYFGPFASYSIAEFFKATLPEPEKGGFKAIHVTQPFTQHEGHTVSQKLLAERAQV